MKNSQQNSDYEDSDKSAARFGGGNASSKSTPLDVSQKVCDAIAKSPMSWWEVAARDKFAQADGIGGPAADVEGVSGCNVDVLFGVKQLSNVRVYTKG